MSGVATQWVSNWHCYKLEPEIIWRYRFISETADKIKIFKYGRNAVPKVTGAWRSAYGPYRSPEMLYRLPNYYHISGQFNLCSLPYSSFTASWGFTQRFSSKLQSIARWKKSRQKTSNCRMNIKHVARTWSNVPPGTIQTLQTMCCYTILAQLAKLFI